MEKQPNPGIVKTRNNDRDDGYPGAMNLSMLCPLLRRLPALRGKEKCFAAYFFQYSLNKWGLRRIVTVWNFPTVALESHSAARE